jgi:endonuclease IV
VRILLWIVDRLLQFVAERLVDEVLHAVDRHAGIGRGHMGKETFRMLMNESRFKKIPMYLETPKGEEKGKDLDKINLQVLRRLIKQ